MSDPGFGQPSFSQPSSAAAGPAQKDTHPADVFAAMKSGAFANSWVPQSAPPVNMQPSKPTSSVLGQYWARSLRSGPPKWIRGNPRNYIDGLTIPEPPSDREYKYRVVKGDVDLGIKPTYNRDGDGSQRVNLLEYNRGYGISDRTPIKVYAGAVGQDGAEEVEETLVARWN